MLLKNILLAAGIAATAFVPASPVHAQAPAASGTTAPAAPDSDFYQFVNATGGAFTDAQISWSFDGGTTWHVLAEQKSAPALCKNGRVYFKLQNDKGTWQDFIEYAQGKGGWNGNTTQVDAFVIPLTISLVKTDGTTRTLGITESRKAIFDAFKAEAPKEFLSCLDGDKQIMSPHMADFKPGAANADYFAKYVDEIWDMYATPKTLPSGWTGKVENGVLTFSKPGQKDQVIHAKPTTEQILLGSGEMSHLPGFCSAFNRHVAADPGDWNNPATYYKTFPYNYYSKFLHQQTVDGKCYGFCYDDSGSQAAFMSGKATHLVVTLYWDAIPPATPHKAPPQ